MRPWIRHLRRSERGSASVEALFWLVMILMVTVMMLDAARLFDVQTTAIRVLQDANRGVSTGLLPSGPDAEDFIEGRLAAISANVTATSLIDASGVVTSTVTIPAGDVRLIGLFDSLRSVDLTVQADHLMEDWGT